MALHANSIEAHENATIVASWVDTLAHFNQGARGEESADLGEGRGPERFAHEAGIELCGAFDGLQRDVAGEAVGHDDVHFPGADVVALDESLEGNRRTLATKPQCGLAQFLMTLQFLGSDVQEADRRRAQAQQNLGEHAAHDGEFSKVLGVAFEIGAEVEHHRLTPAGRNERG